MIKKTLISLSLASAVLAFPIAADTLDKYTQRFNTYQNQLEHGTWGLVDFTPSGERLTPSNPQAYTSGSTLLFEPRWTKRTMRHVLGKSQYQYLESTIGEEEVRRRINNHCEAQLEVGTHQIRVLFNPNVWFGRHTPSQGPTTTHGPRSNTAWQGPQKCKS